ncbi:MAG: hypothetical protein GY765_06105 [bacterium]|nr:hypothetical protein [bacterium]
MSKANKNTRTTHMKIENTNSRPENTTDTEWRHTDLDARIKAGVQSYESDIPMNVEAAFMKELERIAPEVTSGKHRHKRRTMVWGALATAASILLAALLLFSPLFKNTPIPPLQGSDTVEEGVFVDSVSIDGAPADTYIVDSGDSNMTIVWAERPGNES